MQELEYTLTQIFSAISYLIPKFKPVFLILFVWFSFRLAVSLVKVLCQPSRRLPEDKREAIRESKQAIEECIWFTGDCSKCPYFVDCYLVRGGKSHDRS